MRVLARNLRLAAATAASQAHELRKTNEGLQKSVGAARTRVDALKTSGREQADKLLEWDHVFAALGKNLQEVRSACARRTEQCVDLQSSVEELQTQLKEEQGEREEETGRADEAAEKLKLATRKKMRRPQGIAGAAELDARWATMSKEARAKAYYRHCEDINNKLEKSGIHDWNMSALARVLTWRKMIPALMSTKPFCAEKMSLASDLSSILKSEYNAELAGFVMVEAELSASQYQKIRLAICKKYGPKGWEKKLWYQCPSTGKKLWMPEPLAPISAWKKLQQERLKPHGLQLSEDGRVSQRSFIQTARTMMERDREHLKEFTVDRPAQIVFGIDHASISGARDFSVTSRMGVSRWGPCTNLDPYAAASSRCVFSSWVR